MYVNSNPWLALTTMLMCLCVIILSSNSQRADRMYADQSLSGDKTIVSSNGNFELGFFKPGTSQNYYLGIWYRELVPMQTVVWVANREIPIRDTSSSELRISGGNLVLFNESKIPIWSTNLRPSTSTSSSIHVVLLDDGNLVLTNIESDLSDPIWQSFDHPTDSWLPGAKVGFNKITGEKTRLTSWKSKNDPAPGFFSFELESNRSSHNFVLYAGGQPLIFISRKRLNYLFDLFYFNNDREIYFNYSRNFSFIPRLVMDVGGQIQQQIWVIQQRIWEEGGWSLFWSIPRMRCDNNRYCKPFWSCTLRSQSFCQCSASFNPENVHNSNSEFYSSSVVNITSLRCGDVSSINGRKYRIFANDSSMEFSTYPLKVAAAEISIDKDCESNCLGDASCTAYASAYDDCFFWFTDLLILPQPTAESGGSINVRLAVLQFPKHHNNKGKLNIAYIAGSGMAAIVTCLVVFIILRRRRSINKRNTADGLLMAYDYKELQNATKNFSEKLGKGGFGSVFKGTLPDSSLIAVKKLESISQGDKQFRAEVSTIGTIQHVNLVRLRGFCSQGTTKLLVYDYMPNGSLDTYLFQRNDFMFYLEWRTRNHIALGIAKALAYLHERCRECIIHCDIKPENILLDGKFSPKLSDFGLAKLFGRDFSRVLTTMRGTIGYLAPEWISGEAITPKADVYSYGMMLFELVSGRRNLDESENGKEEYFPLQVARLINKNGHVLNLLDSKLKGRASIEELTRVCKVACWCIQESETERPSMSQIVYFLEGTLEVDMPPIPRLLQELAWRSPGVSHS